MRVSLDCGWGTGVTAQSPERNVQGAHGVKGVARERGRFIPGETISGRICADGGCIELDVKVGNASEIGTQGGLCVVVWENGDSCPGQRVRLLVAGDAHMAGKPVERGGGAWRRARVVAALQTAAQVAG